MKKSRARKGRSFESLDEADKSRRRKRPKSLSTSRELREKDDVRDRSRATSRESVSSGREVRCACQYYQSDSLLPDRVSPFGSRPTSRNANTVMATAIGDHEYEPINPPPPPMLSGSQKQGESETERSSIPEPEKHFVRIPLDKELVVQESVEEDEEEEEDEAMAEDPKSPEDMEVEQIAAAQEMQDSIENRYLGATPTTTTASMSRTDCDVNTSMLDSSGLEDLPLNRGSRNKKTPLSKTEQMRAQAQGIHQKLRSQAGKLRSKLRSIPKPSFNLKSKSQTDPNQPETEKPAEKSRFRLPDRPKFNLPDRPKFNLPERPKFNLPERPKFKLPERPKFKLPERPTFNLPERPKFNLPQRPKISLPSFGKNRAAARERQQSTVSNAGSRKNLFEFDFKTYPKLFNKKSKQRGDYATSSPKQTRGNTPPPKMRSDDLQSAGQAGPVSQKWLNKFDDIQYADDDIPNFLSAGRHGDGAKDRDSRRSERSESLSDFRDKDMGYTEDLEVGRLPPGRRTISTKSSLSHLSDREVQSSGSSEDRHRKGVLEEIDSDEFFLRQKGISQEDIDMGKYLSEEIREAFRSPVVNALAQMDYEYDDLDVENIDPKKRNGDKPEPSRPSRSRSLRKKSIASKTSENEIMEDIERYRTYPPRRPSRKSRSKSKSNLNAEGVISETPHRYQNEFQTEINGYADQSADKTHRYENNASPIRHENNKTPSRYENNKSPSRQELGTTPSRYENDAADDKGRYANLPYEDNVSEYYKTPGPATEYQHYKVPRSDAPVAQPTPTPTPTKRKSSTKDGTIKKRSDGWVEVDIETSLEEVQEDIPPQPLKRQKSRKSLVSKQESTEEWVQKPEPQLQLDEKVAQSVEPDYIIPSSPNETTGDKPVPPVRTRSLSRGRSLHSLKIEDEKAVKNLEETSQIINHIESIQQVNEVVVPETKVEVKPEAQELIKEAAPEPLPPKIHHYEVTGDDDMTFGYATVGKPTTSATLTTFERPDRHKKPKPPRPPPPRKKRATPSPTFNTMPRSHSSSQPVRPLRNYSTLGPSRPPRRHRSTSIGSAEHIYTDDRQSVAYAELNESVPKTQPVEEVHTVLQTEEVIEKMKVRPLPAPPRPPRDRRAGKGSSDEWQDEAIDLTEEDKISIAVLRGEVYPLENAIQQEVAAFVHEPPGTEVVEEVCVSTQTDPLPEDYCMEGEDDPELMEFSHEQLKIQEAFLEEMRKEEERIQKEMEAKRLSRSENGPTEDMKISSEVIKQIDEIIAEEKKLLLERQRAEETRLAEEKKQQDARLAEEKIQEEARRAEEKKQQEIEEERKRQELQFAEEKQKAQELQDAERKRQELQLAEEERKRLELQLVEEKRKAQERQEEIRKMKELQLAEEKRIAQERQEQEKRLEAEKRAAEERKRQEEKLKREKAEEEKWIAEEERRLAEDRKKAEERRAAEEKRRQDEETKRKAEELKQKSKQEKSDLDMGYASLDRRQSRPAESAGSSQNATGAIPRTHTQATTEPNTTVDMLRSERLQVKELDVEKLNVSQLQANSITVTQLQGNRLTIQDLDGRAGSLALGNFELPPDFIQQILARIPWEEIRPPQLTSAEHLSSIPAAPTPTSTPVDTILPPFSQLRGKRHPLEESDEDALPTLQPRRPHRRHHRPSRYSSEEDDERQLVRRHPSRSAAPPNITDLSQQLARACTSAGFRAMRSFADRIRPCLQSEEKTNHLKTVMCIVLVMIAGFFLLTFNSRSVNHIHWDFQFPPQPPPLG